MDDINSEFTAKERISFFLDSIPESKAEFSRKTGLSISFLKQKKIGTTLQNLVIICTTYPQLSMEWIALGKGNMLKYQSELSQINFKLRGKKKSAVVPVEQLIAHYEEIIKTLRLLIDEKDKRLNMQELELNRKDKIISKYEKKKPI